MVRGCHNAACVHLRGGTSVRRPNRTAGRHTSSPQTKSAPTCVSICRTSGAVEQHKPLRRQQSRKLYFGPAVDAGIGAGIFLSDGPGAVAVTLGVVWEFWHDMTGTHGGRRDSREMATFTVVCSAYLSYLVHDTSSMRFVTSLLVCSSNLRRRVVCGSTLEHSSRELLHHRASRVANGKSNMYLNPPEADARHSNPSYFRRLG